VDLRPLLGADEIRRASELTRRITLAPPILRRIAEFVAATHPDSPGAPPDIQRFVRYGVSPRGARALALCAKARALMEGRPHVSLADVRTQALPALRHRLILSFEAEAEGVGPDRALTALLPRLSAGPTE
jgi:MoxR-like ATPase